MSTPRRRLSAEAYVKGIRRGDRMILSRAITLVESKLKADQELADQVINLVLPFTGKSIRIGITGAPGVGKSTFIEQFGRLIIEKGHRLAVMSVDPSSTRSGGSILGDKTRMEQLSKTSHAYIRPSPGGEQGGGIGVSTREAILLCEAAGYDVVVVETIGVGQSEVRVKEMVDFFMLLVQPGAGDELQGVKRGIMEMVDAIVVNKADGENLPHAWKAQQELKNACKFLSKGPEGEDVNVLMASSRDGKGLGEIWKEVRVYIAKIEATGLLEQIRSAQRVSWFYTHVQQALERKFYQDPQVKEEIAGALEKIRIADVSPAGVARSLVNSFFKK